MALILAMRTVLSRTWNRGRVGNVSVKVEEGSVVKDRGRLDGRSEGLGDGDEPGALLVLLVNLE